MINICSNVALVSRVPTGATYSDSEGNVLALTWATANVREWFATGALAPACLLGTEQRREVVSVAGRFVKIVGPDRGR